ncbi:MAG TPA: SgcJ/EcaC family oxidoreductase [Alphaproteobacteria bacterium]
MPTDHDQIRTLIERWAKAVQACDLEGVLADHTDDIVMFDVPPPEDGARGFEAYRATWEPFFVWLRQGAIFEIVALDIAAGTDVAFAHALLRCGMPAHLAQHPQQRLRLTIGLRKQGGRWRIAHEHHSFTDAAYKT